MFDAISPNNPVFGGKKVLYTNYSQGPDNRLLSQEKLDQQWDDARNKAIKLESKGVSAEPFIFAEKYPTGTGDVFTKTNVCVATREHADALKAVNEASDKIEMIRPKPHEETARSFAISRLLGKITVALVEKTKDFIFNVAEEES